MPHGTCAMPWNQSGDAGQVSTSMMTLTCSATSSSLTLRHQPHWSPAWMHSLPILSLLCEQHRAYEHPTYKQPYFLNTCKGSISDFKGSLRRWCPASSDLQRKPGVGGKKVSMQITVSQFWMNASIIKHNLSQWGLLITKDVEERVKGRGDKGSMA